MPLRGEFFDVAHIVVMSYFCEMLLGPFCVGRSTSTRRRSPIRLRTTYFELFSAVSHKIAKQNSKGYLLLLSALKHNHCHENQSLMHSGHGRRAWLGCWEYCKLCCLSFLVCSWYDTVLVPKIETILLSTQPSSVSCVRARLSFIGGTHRIRQRKLLLVVKSTDLFSKVDAVIFSFCVECFVFL